MADERGDSRFSSFLAGFLIGSLLAGGGAAVYIVGMEREQAYQVANWKDMAEVQRDKAARAISRGHVARKAAAEQRERAEEALKKVGGK